VTEELRRRGLGRGLSALFGDEAAAEGTAEPPRAPRLIPVEKLHPSRYQPRRHFDPAALDALVDSVRAQGILQPLLVRPHPDLVGAYEIIAGERRWRAAQAAQLHEVPVVLRELGDRAALEIALVENVQREDLSSLEEAEGYRRLMEEFGHGQEELARAVGKSRSHVANALRLLTLPEPVRRLVDEGKLSAGHARALIGLDNALELAEEVVRRGLNVRQAERLSQAKKRSERPSLADIALRPKDADTAALEREMTELLGLKVSISFTGLGGVVTVQYRTLEQLDDVIRRLGTTPIPAAGEAV
jgi:ParB family transcriptional regulator, chromosome partitioning protein